MILVILVCVTITQATALAKHLAGRRRYYCSQRRLRIPQPLFKVVFFIRLPDVDSLCGTPME